MEFLKHPWSGINPFQLEFFKAKCVEEKDIDRFVYKQSEWKISR